MHKADAHNAYADADADADAEDLCITRLSFAHTAALLKVFQLSSWKRCRRSP